MSYGLTILYERANLNLQKHKQTFINKGALIMVNKPQALQRMLNEDGVIAALAIDQRGSLKKMLAQNTDQQITDQDICEFKTVISQEMTAYSSAILLDPEYGLAAAKVRDRNCGLLLAYEKTGYDVSEPGRMPDLLPTCSVKRLKEAGADAIKFMLYYDVDEPQRINNQKQAFVERIGSECSAEGLPFFLELMSYDAKIDDTKSKEYAAIKPHKVIEMMSEFSLPRYNVDVLKVEVPVNMDYVAGFGTESIYTKAEAATYFKEQTKAANGVPFIFLSAGVSARMFQDTLYFAHEAGSTFNGVLCGRATWKDSVVPFAKDGKNAAKLWCDTQGRQNIAELNAVLKKTATPLSIPTLL